MKLMKLDKNCSGGESKTLGSSEQRMAVILIGMPN